MCLNRPICTGLDSLVVDGYTYITGVKRLRKIERRDSPEEKAKNVLEKRISGTQSRKIFETNNSYRAKKCSDESY